VALGLSWIVVERQEESRIRMRRREVIGKEGERER